MSKRVRNMINRAAEHEKQTMLKDEFMKLNNLDPAEYKDYSYNDLLSIYKTI